MLIANWRDAWKFLSVQASALGLVASTVWIALPEAQKDQVLSNFGTLTPAKLALGTFVAAIVGRLINQKKA